MRRRAELVGRLTDALTATAPTGVVQLRGSLAEHGGDPFSDIDLQLTVHAQDFEGCLLTIRPAIEDVHPVRLFRVDPETTSSLARRLIFVLFCDLPLFWRLDLEVAANPPPGAPTSALSDVPWSKPTSALMNAVAAIKALARGETDTATGLLSRGFARIGAVQPAGPLDEAVIALAASCARQDSHLLDVVRETRELASSLLHG